MMTKHLGGKICAHQLVTKHKIIILARNLDLEYSYHETVTVTPRNKAFMFRYMERIPKHPAIIGMAFIVDDYPLYYDATNEAGLSIAGLNFPDNAHYNKPIPGKDNIASFELIPWLLSNCATVVEARKLLENINITNDAFNDELPPSTLHWMIADKEESVVFEQTKTGSRVFDNPLGVMTNNPTFDYHMIHIADYMNCSADLPKNRIAADVNITPYSPWHGRYGNTGRFILCIEIH